MDVVARSKTVIIVRLVGQGRTIVTIVVGTIVIMVVRAVYNTIQMIVKTSVIARAIETIIVIVINVVTSAFTCILPIRVLIQRHKLKVEYPLLILSRSQGFWYNYMAIPFPEL